MNHLEVEELQGIVFDLYNIKTRAEVLKDIGPEEVEAIANELDNTFSTTDHSLCIKVEFRYVRGNESIVRALNYMYKRVFNNWTYRSYIGRAVI